LRDERNSLGKERDCLVKQPQQAQLEITGLEANVKKLNDKFLTSISDIEALKDELAKVTHNYCRRKRVHGE